MEFKFMAEEHVQQIAELEKLCFTAPWSFRSIQGELTNQLALWVVALDGEKLVGYVGSQSVLGEADMLNLAVDPAYRRMGVGAQLVCALVDRLEAMGVYCLTLEVRVSNQPAIRLYHRLGFVQVGCRRNYYSNPREDALILRKDF